MVQALFVHGMGRSPLSGWPLLWSLRRAGLVTRTFGYLVSTEDFAAIRRRLVARIALLATRDSYVLIGHSLGGVLIRDAVNALAARARRRRAMCSCSARRIRLRGSRRRCKATRSSAP